MLHVGLQLHPLRALSPVRRASGPWRRVAAALALLAGLAACAAPDATRVLERPGDLPARALVADVPFVAQEDYYCGPASLEMMLAWSGEAVSQRALAGQVYTPGQAGTLRTDLVAGARRHGRLAVPIAPTPGGADGGDLRRLLRELAAGHPVIVFQNLALPILPRWHFAVALGYDLESGELVLHSGRTERKRMGLDAFARSWAGGERWALAVLPPDELPATAGERAVLRAAIGLERAGQPAAAARAYAAIAGRWPDSFAARMGQGNALHALGRHGAAAAAFRAATRLRPDAPEGWNNLAYAERALGRHAAAVEAAERAVARAEAAAGAAGGAAGGTAGAEAADGAAAYRATLAEMRAASERAGD